MFKEIAVLRISVGTLFKLVALGLTLSLIPLTLLLGIFALFGASTVNWNQQPVTGVSGLLTSPLIGLLLATAFTMFLGTCMAFGLWLYSKFRPLTLRVKVANNEIGA